MFYFDEINGKKILKSDILNNVKHFFTTRESIIKTKEPDFENVVNENKKIICDYLDISQNDLISPSQTHTNHVEIAQIGKNNYPETDGLILDNAKQAVFLKDRKSTRLNSSHAL